MKLSEKELNCMKMFQKALSAPIFQKFPGEHTQRPSNPRLPPTELAFMHSVLHNTHIKLVATALSIVGIIFGRNYINIINKI